MTATHERRTRLRSPARAGVLLLAVMAAAGCSQASQPSTPRTATAASSPGPLRVNPATAVASASVLDSAAAAASQSAAAAAYASLTCAGKTASTQAGQAPPTTYVAACSADGATKYLLGPSLVSGADVSSANATAVAVNGAPTGAWQIDLRFDATGTSEFAAATRQLYTQYSNGSASGAFAIVLDGVVQSAPVVNQGAITGGQAQITGQFTRSQAQNLATALNYGALPLTFTLASSSVDVSGLAHLTFRPGGSPLPTTAVITQASAIANRRISALKLGQVVLSVTPDPASGALDLDVTCPNAEVAEVTGLLAPAVLLFRPVLQSEATHTQ